MDLSKFIRLNLNAVYRNGVSLFSDKEILADCVLGPHREGSKVRGVVVRFALPIAEAQQLYDALHSGDSELNIEGAGL